MSQQKQRTKEVESTTIEPETRTTAAPTAPTLGTDRIGVENQRLQRLPTAGQGGNVEPVRAATGAAEPNDVAWTLKLQPDGTMKARLPPKPTVSVTNRTTHEELHNSIGDLLTEPIDFTIYAKGAVLGENNMEVLKDVTQLILKADASSSASARAVPTKDEVATKEPAASAPPAIAPGADAKPVFAATTAPPVVAEVPSKPAAFTLSPRVNPDAGSSSVSRTPASESSTKTAAASVSKVIPGRPNVSALPYTDDPTAKKDEVKKDEEASPAAAAAAAAEEDLRKAANAKAQAQREAQQKADEAKQREIEALAHIASEKSKESLTIAVGTGTFTFYCNPATVTVADICAFIVQQDSRFAAVKKIDLSVDSQPLTADNARKLLRNRTLVTTPTAPSGG
ncbi:Hypothetical protein, putative [Bodo saltans]|uniref:Uncharacterized protein n=1 Tax=Bodo saltans TaxID=75058 RepID=A0A0S4JSL1_BODSA|nr:Hypothetical protein, putative [Bodo saltans]|eukprot:CUG93217.1 Hypothetical protein, putative [Bodo saltans]